jgi:O-antigen ligase
MTLTKVATAGPLGRNAKAFSTVLIFLLPALALTTRFGMVLIQLMFLLTAAWLGNKGFSGSYAANARVVGPLVVAFLGYFLISLARMLYFDQDTSTIDGPSRLLFALTCVGVVVLLRPRIEWFWIGLFVGTVSVAVIAAVQWFLLGMERATGFTHHAITFGDLSVAMGVMSLCALSEFRKTRLAWMPIVAMLCGVGAAVLSGSRGSWIGLLLVVFPLLRYGSPAHGKRLWYAVGIALFALVAGYFVPGTGIASRISLAVVEVQRYFATGDATTSVGIRLELWKASLMMVAEHPWLGVGRAEFRPAMLAMAEQGRLQMSPALDFMSAHNDVLHILATGGVVDFAFLLMLYAAPLYLFWTTLQRGGPERAAPALAGLVLVICFIGFGLTDVMFWLMATKVFYAMMVCVLAGFCLMPTAPRTDLAAPEGNALLHHALVLDARSRAAS